jgi:hypothetical protein
MPTATSFAALGRGNGFPYCNSRVDVSKYDNFAALSLRQAMSLYWNLSNMFANITSSLSESSDDVNYSFTKNASGSPIVSPDPIDRVCGNVSISPRTFSNGFTEEELSETSGAACGGNGSFSSSLTVIQRLYNGDINNESNFVGYGISSLYSALASFGHLEGVLSGSASIQIGSYLNGTTETGQDGPDPEGDPSVVFFAKKASGLSIGGIPFRSFTSANVSTNSPSNLSKNIISSGSSASVSGSWTFTSEDGSFNDSGSAGVSAPGFGFYNYTN